MKPLLLQKITRTEVYFTSHLYQVSKNKPAEMGALLCDKLHLSKEVKIEDSSFEFCFFRDMAKNELIERLDDSQRKSFEKQTFDNIYILSDKSIVIIEAKAQQKFAPKQINALVDAKNIIKDSKVFPCEEVYLIGLHSSKYAPKDSTINNFDSTITWAELAKCLGDDERVFARADKIYNK